MARTLKLFLLLVLVCPGLALGQGDGVQVFGRASRATGEMAWGWWDSIPRW